MTLYDKGTYGKIYKSGNIIEKRFNLFFKNDELICPNVAELVFLSNVSHPHIVSYNSIGFNIETYDCTMQMDYSGPNLFHIAMEFSLLKRCAYLPRIVCDILSALSFLESHHIIHGDIKPQNIVFNTKTEITKLIDWGSVNYSVETTSWKMCTELFAAPETDTKPCLNSDIFSVGLIVQFLIYGIYFKHELVGERISLFVEDERIKPEFKKSLSNIRFDKEFIDICNQMLTIDPLKRPTATQLYNMDYFAPYRRREAESILYIDSAPISYNIAPELSSLREIIINWLLVTNNIFKNHIKVFVYASWLFDRILQEQTSIIPEEKYYLFGYGCFVIANAYYCYFVSIYDILEYTEFDFIASDIKGVVSEILIGLKFKLIHYNFVDKINYINTDTIRTIVLDHGTRSSIEKLELYKIRTQLPEPMDQSIP